MAHITSLVAFELGTRIPVTEPAPPPTVLRKTGRLCADLTKSPKGAHTRLKRGDSRSVQSVAKGGQSPQDRPATALKIISLWHDVELFCPSATRGREAGRPPRERTSTATARRPRRRSRRPAHSHSRALPTTIRPRTESSVDRPATPLRALLRCQSGPRPVPGASPITNDGHLVGVSGLGLASPQSRRCSEAAAGAIVAASASQRTLRRSCAMAAAVGVR